ncbi:uncharacterized protein LOC109720171 [Ananas comosus]|uniref:Uncharacterized protein LOC109720171 n=1 Tax=Ananas comosus TaxID=4615 RepID=A0A6P5GA10_ANACO|nr:uncharacterized protein LOC109720171 [Ananas comosus]
MQWYWTITRRWISTPIQRPPLAYQPHGHVKRVLVDIVQRSYYTIRRVLPDISGGRVLTTLSQVADQMEAVLETFSTLPHYVPPGPADYGGASTSGHAPVYSPPRPSSPIEEPPYADVTDPTLAPAPQDPARAGNLVYFRRRRHMRSTRTDQPSSLAPPRPDILPAHATTMIEPVIEGAAIERLDQLEIIEPFYEHDVGRGRGRRCGRGRGHDRRRGRRRRT